MSEFYSAEEIQPRYEEIVPVYQKAFAGPPWYEVSMCPDPEQRCTGGLSPIEVGERCQRCLLRPAETAYPAERLIARLGNIGKTRETSWYIEENECGLTLAALAWLTTARVVAEEKYADVPAMQGWLSDRFGDRPFVWLDEVFANKLNQVSGNLANFAGMCRGFQDRLGNDLPLAYRTITPQMIAAAARDFEVAPLEVPDWRSFIMIERGSSS